jgi:hypothetical protein
MKLEHAICVPIVVLVSPAGYCSDLHAYVASRFTPAWVRHCVRLVRCFGNTHSYFLRSSSFLQFVVDGWCEQSNNHVR